MAHVHQYKRGRGNVETCSCGRWRGTGTPIIAQWTCQRCGKHETAEECQYCLYLP